MGKIVISENVSLDGVVQDPELRKGQQACVLNLRLRVDAVGDWPAVAGDGRWLGVDLVGEQGEGPREAGFGRGLEGDGDR
ncbi:MAG TPA: hypothetical protein VHN16_09645, partial [Streptosporangiaceae bacterium]|nr:hypothetical protein [Streptosporangiaceae bacterium]